MAVKNGNGDAPKKAPTREEVELFALLNARSKEMKKHQDEFGSLLRAALRPGGPALEGFAYEVSLSEPPQVSSTLDYRGWLIDQVGEERVIAREREVRETKLPGTPRLVVAVNSHQPPDSEIERDACYKKFELMVTGAVGRDPVRQALAEPESVHKKKLGGRAKK